MKYIRTKDGIYEVVNEVLLCGTKFYVIEAQDHIFRVRADKVKEANSIEELCDVFVAVRKNASGTYSVFFIEFEDWKTWISGYDIYGAIWTAKGLIYVAKMNESGVLELI